MATEAIAEGKAYDYIICGGGTAGCVLAGRLVEAPTLSVLLIEAGADDANLQSTQMVSAYAQVFGTEGDWCIKVEPLKHANGRHIAVHRGRFLGGSSGCNACLMIRGTKQYYDNLDVPGWSGEEMFAIISKSRTMTGALS